MIEIIEPGYKLVKYEVNCPVCGCKFTYDISDVSGAELNLVQCPCCRHAVEHIAETKAEKYECNNDCDFCDVCIKHRRKCNGCPMNLDRENIQPELDAECEHVWSAVKTVNTSDGKFVTYQCARCKQKITVQEEVVEH